jgi:nucleotide-binding universal stress UspA family protein
MRGAIVVGVDGSEQAFAAADYAAAMAGRRHAPLRLVMVYESVVYGLGPSYLTGNYAAGIDEELLRDAVKQTLGELTRRVTTAHPEVEIESVLREGGAAACLIAESQEATVTVVGSRGHGGFSGLLLGAVSTQVATHGSGTVVVVRPGSGPGGPVVAGVDGSPQAQAALEWAAGEAISRGVTLIAANAYWEEPWGLGPKPDIDPAVTAAHEAARMVEQAVKPLQEKHPDLRVEVRTWHSMDPEHSLVEESAHAGLTVVGSRGRGGFAGMLLGSTSRALVHHAHGPVAVVHSR